jgi:hypothetical protein
MAINFSFNFKEMALHEDLDRSSCSKTSVALQKRIIMSAAPWGASGDIEGTRAAESDLA